MCAPLVWKQWPSGVARALPYQLSDRKMINWTPPLACYSHIRRPGCQCRWANETPVCLPPAWMMPSSLHQSRGERWRWCVCGSWRGDTADVTALHHWTSHLRMTSDAFLPPSEGMHTHTQPNKPTYKLAHTQCRNSYTQHTQTTHTLHSSAPVYAPISPLCSSYHGNSEMSGHPN